MERIGGVADRTLLATIEQVIAKYGLADFRAALSAILDTIERRDLELAVFGRVSTGKSSLLNRLLERDVLPVGVTPITAVPTRITFGPRPRLRVWFAEMAPRELRLDAIPDYASERLNPANVKHVMRLLVDLPSPFLQAGVTLVDTPGLGSLATSGAAETLAYLPHCDVAAVLVDGGSTISAEDLGTIALLLTAGIRVWVLVSKADLLAPGDLDAAMAYARDMLAREVDAAIHVAAVSVRPGFESLFEHWRTEELEPVIADHDRERERAAARKTALLQSQVAARLRQLLDAPDARSTGPEAAVLRSTDLVLQTAGGRITELEREIERLVLELPRRDTQVFARAAELIDGGVEPRAALARAFREATGQAAAEIGRELHDLAVTLAEVLRGVDRTLETEDQASAGLAAAGTLREIPIPELPPDIVVPGERSERLFGRGLARSVLARRLGREVGVATRGTLDAYAAVLRRWALDALGRIRGQWTAGTDTLRVRIDRRLGHDQARSASRNEILQDLDRLTALMIP